MDILKDAQDVAALGLDGLDSPTKMNVVNDLGV